MSLSPLDRGSSAAFMEPARSAQDVVLPAVCVDHRRVRLSKGTGASIYAEGLRRGVRDAGWALTALTDAPGAGFVPPGRVWRWAASLPPWPARAQPCRDGLVATDAFRRAQVHFDIYRTYLRLRATARPSLMHWSYPLPLRLAGVPNIYSVLDLIPLLQPDLTPIRRSRSLAMLKRLRHEADHLVTISETSRRDIVATLGWPADRVTNTYLPVEPPAWTAPQAAAARSRGAERAGVTEQGYFLYVGTIETRKNIARMIEAYRLSGSRRALVLAGPDGWQASAELAGAVDLLVPPGVAARQAEGRPRVIRIDWVERELLLGLISGATALLAPSLAEGFGIPAVEAMAFGTPALTSQFGASAEVAGPAAMLVDPYDVRGLAQALLALDGDAGLRARLSEAGRARSRMFSAAAYAGRLSSLYASVLSRHATIT